MTSGGADPVPPMTAEEEKVLAILGPKAFKWMAFTVRAFEEHADILQNSSLVLINGIIDSDPSVKPCAKWQLVHPQERLSSH